MFPVYILEDINNLPDDSICFLVSDKIYLKKNTGLVESLIPVKEIVFKDQIVPYAKLHIKKLPAKLIAKIIAFFRTITESIKSEAIVLLCYNPKNKKYKMIIPKQDVSYASVKYTPISAPPGYILMSTIHSHNTFGAFHSGTDIADEEGFDGLHVTFGNVDDENITISASVVVNNMRFLVDPTLYLNGIEEVESTQRNWNIWIKNDNKINLRYKSTYDQDVFIDPDWYKNLTKSIPRFNQRRGHSVPPSVFGTFESFEDLYNLAYEGYLLPDVLDNKDNSSFKKYVKFAEEPKNNTIMDFSKIMNFKRTEESIKYDPCFNCPFNKKPDNSLKENASDAKS